jgi:hypothetical protein
LVNRLLGAKSAASHDHVDGVEAVVVVEGCGSRVDACLVDANRVVAEQLDVVGLVVYLDPVDAAERVRCWSWTCTQGARLLSALRLIERAGLLEPVDRLGEHVV